MQGALKYGFYEYFKDSLAARLPADKRPEGGKLPIPAMIVVSLLSLLALLPLLLLPLLRGLLLRMLLPTGTTDADAVVGAICVLVVLLLGLPPPTFGGKVAQA